MYRIFLIQLVSSLLLSFNLHAQQVSGINLLSATEFIRTLDSMSSKQIIDVRTPEEYASGHIAGAKNINLYDKDFADQLSRLEKQTPVFVYCKIGGRSGNAAKLLQDMGFADIYDLQGGIMAWEKQKLPLQTVTNNKTGANSFARADFDHLLASNKWLLVDFHAPWCIPCKQMEPYLNKLTKEFKNQVAITRINIDNAKALAKELDVERIPVISLYKNGKEVKRVNGLQTEAQLRALIQYLLKI